MIAVTGALSKRGGVSECFGKQIEKINMPPMDYHLKLLRCNGQHRDEGIRLNSFLKGFHLNGFPAQATPGSVARFVEGGLPDNGVYNVTFTDGSSSATRWGVFTASPTAPFNTFLDDMVSYFVDVDN